MISRSDEAMENLSVYAEGIRDSSKMLRDMTEYFDAQDEPVLLVFWGDHLPAMGANFGAFREIGLTTGDESGVDSALDTYATPYVIWANEAFDAQYGFRDRVNKLDMGADDRISDIYLGELVYELLDMQGADAYFDYLGQARRTLSVLCTGRSNYRPVIRCLDLPCNRSRNSLIMQFDCFRRCRLQ